MGLSRVIPFVFVHPKLFPDPEKDEEKHHASVRFSNASGKPIRPWHPVVDQAHGVALQRLSAAERPGNPAAAKYFDFSFRPIRRLG